MSAKLIALINQQAEDADTRAQALHDIQAEGVALTAAQEAELTAALADVDKFGARLVELVAQEKRRTEARKAHEAFASALPEGGNPVAGPTSGLELVRTSPRSIGEQFAASKQLADFNKRGGTGNSGVFTFSLISSKDANSKPMAGVTPAKRGQVEPVRTTPLLDACYVEMTDRNDYSWEEWALTVPVAGDVAEGAPAAESADAYVMKFGSLGKAAHHIPITRETLQVNSAVASRVEGRLMQGVRDKAEAKVGAAIVAATLPTATHATGLLEAIRVGMAESVLRGFPAVDVVLNPYDAADIDLDLLQRTLNGAVFNSPKWQLNPIEAGAIPVGTAYVGRLYDAVSVFARTEVQLFATDSHGTDFIEEKLRLLASQRLSAHVTQGNALIECTVVP